MHLVLAYDSQHTLNDEIVLRLWYLVDETKQIILHGQDNTPAQIAMATRGYTFVTIVLIMSPDVNVLQVPRPPGSLNKIRQALPYLLEEQLIDDVDTLHFTILNHTEKQTLIVAVIKHDLLQNCVQAFTQAGLAPEIILPVWLALPAVDIQQWCIMVNAEYLWLRTGNFTGFAIETAVAPALLETLYAKQSPTAIECIVEHQPVKFSWLAENDVNEHHVMTVLTAPDTWLAHIIKNLPAVQMLPNLLHSEFSFKQQIKAQKKSWKLVAVLTASVFAIWILGMVGQYFYYGWSLYQLNQVIEASYQKIFPGTKLTNNPRIVVDRELTRIARGELGNDFLNLLLRVGEIMQKKPQVHITQINYVNHRLVLAVTTDNFSRLRQLDKEFVQQGLPVEQEEATSINGVVQARWVIG